MKNTIPLFTEKQVLEELGIPDFRHLSKDKIMTFLSMLPNADPDVVLKAIEQFPVYADFVKEIVADFTEIVKAALNENAKDNKSYYDSCNIILNALSKLLEKEDLSFEERKYIIEQLLEVEDRMNKKNTESKEFYLKVIKIAAATLVVGACAAATVLGVKSRFSVPKIKH